MTRFVLLSKMKCNITQSKIFKKWEVSPNIKLNHEGTDYTATSTSRANLNVTGGIRIGTDATDHNLYELIIFSSKLSESVESFIEQSM